MRTVLVVAFVAACACVAAAAPYEIGVDFAPTGAWQVAGREFIARHATAGFRPLDAVCSAADCAEPGAVTFFGIPVFESRVFFAAGFGVRRIELSLYNKGDAGPLGRDAFADLVKRARAALAPDATGDSPRPARESRNGVIAKVQRWPRRTTPAELAWAWTQADDAPFLSEYVTVTLTAQAGDVGAPAQAKGRRDIAKNLVRTETGDVYLGGLPMVDQGQKGYCAAATSERVLRYYGLDADEHEIAQLAGTSAGGGTSEDGMIEAVKRIGGKYRLGLKIVCRTDFMKELALYNQTARKMKAEELRPEAFVRDNCFFAGELMAALRPEVVRAYRAKMTAPSAQFKRAVREAVDAGVPLFWGVTLGWFPEVPELPQAAGGHMRLIIGYNSRTKEILYTDSWGAGHALKRMDEDQAWAMTNALLYLKPRQ